MKHFLLFLFIFICLPVMFVFSQNNYDETEFVINSFVFIVDGYTRNFAIIHAANFVVGEEITGFSGLEKYIQDKTQLLLNQRVLDSASIEYTLDARQDRKYNVNLVVSVKDTWNIIAIPRPQYSSSSGFDITIKARDYNFLGTMMPLRIDLGYRYDEDGRTYYDFLFDSDIPFEFFNLRWIFNFDHELVYQPDRDEPYYYMNTTGLSVELPFKQTTLTLGFNESFIFNQDNTKKDRYFYGDSMGEFQDGFYMSSNPYLFWKLPFNVKIGEYDELVYKPGVSAVFNHEVSDSKLQDHRKGPFLTFDHSLEFGRIDWIGNFLKGYKATIYNSYTYNFNNPDFNYEILDTAINDNEPLSIFVGTTAAGHLTFEDFFGINARVMYRQWFLGEYSIDAGDVLRGIIDNDVKADFMISLNFDIPMRLIKFRPSHWFEKPKLRGLNFDVHFSPFIDAAIYRSPEIEKEFKDYDFTYKNVLASGGMEVIIFPEFFRSLFLRASLGFNFSTMLNMSRYELFIGTELHF